MGVGSRVKDGCVQESGCWEPNPGPAEERPLLLTAEAILFPFVSALTIRQQEICSLEQGLRRSSVVDSYRWFCHAGLEESTVTVCSVDRLPESREETWVSSSMAVTQTST